MSFSTRLAVVLFSMVALASPAHAKTANLGLLTQTGTTFGNVFFANGGFADYYTFSIGMPGSVSGTTADTSYVLFFTKDVTLSSLVLTSGATSAVLAQDTTPNSFSFAGLTAGSYTLAVNGSVSGSSLLPTLGGYSGSIKAVSSSVASAAPEPADLALTFVGLAGVGMLVRRRAAR
jgi:hypothetical protein